MSLLVPLLKPRSLPPSSTLQIALPACVYTAPDHRRQRRDLPQRRKHHDDTGGRAARGGEWQQRRVEDVFIHALVAAGSCRRHRPQFSNRTRRTYEHSAARPTHHTPQPMRHFSSCMSKKDQEVALLEDPRDTPEITKEQYRSLVDIYKGFGKPRSKEPAINKEDVERPHQRLAPRLVLTAEQERGPADHDDDVLPPISSRHLRQIRHFTHLVKSRFGYVDLEQLWDAYVQLQSPRPRYMQYKHLTRLFEHLAWTQYKDLGNVAENYFTLLNDCVNEKVPLDKSVWNTAIQFAGKRERWTTDVEMKEAIETWMRMENAGLEADIVTFSVLFQLAVRSERFALAEAIFEELKQRGIELDRIFRIYLIQYAGARRDGEKVRQAFRDLVNAGEIVDTSVMNAVILGLFRAGEFGAAEHVFYRMKALHEEKFGMAPPRDWQTKKELSKLLNKTGRDLRKEKEQHEASFFGAAYSDLDKREEIQKATPIGPDAGTYQILIKHHAFVSGELDKIKTFLREMHEQGLRVHGSVYVNILCGFQTHGGYYYSNWDLESLEALWKEVLDPEALRRKALESREERSAPLSPAEPSEAEEADDFDMLGAMMSERSDPFLEDDQAMSMDHGHPLFAEDPLVSDKEDKSEQSTPEGQPDDQKHPMHQGYRPFPEDSLLSDDKPSPEQSVPKKRLSFQKDSDSPPHADDAREAGEHPDPEGEYNPATRPPEDSAQVTITTGLALASIYAFHKCAGKKRMLQIWDEIQNQLEWDRNFDRRHVQNVVDRLAGR